MMAAMLAGLCLLVLCKEDEECCTWARARIEALPTAGKRKDQGLPRNCEGVR
jgi:hypothetical protein